MTQQQRLNELLALVSERGNVSIADITDTLGISAATARRKLTTLADQRLITRTHGGAAALGSGYELPLHYKVAQQAEAKVAIARAATRLINPGSSVGLNGGTTTSEVARELGRSDVLRSRGRDDGVAVTIVTNALNIAYELSVRSHVRIVVTGGVARRQSYELVGPLVANSLANIALDLAILGADGIDAEFGVTTFDEGEAGVSRDFARVARKVVVVADSTKMAQVKFARICGLSDIDVIVTDAPLPGEIAAAASTAGIEVIVAT